MRIAFLAQPFDRMDPPVRAGSLALWIYYMAKLCVERGHEAVVFSYHGGAISARSTSSDGVEYVFTPTGSDRLLNKASQLRRKLFPGSSTRAAATPTFALHHSGYAMEAARRARLQNCDVVHIMNYSQFVPVVRRFHPSATIALHMQCEWLTQLDPELIRPRLEHADIIIGCSEYITRKIAAAFPSYADRCVTVPNAADIAPGEQGVSGSKKALFVGRLSPEKGLHDLIRAFHHVLVRHPDARLHLVGGAGTVPLDLLVGLSNEPHVHALREFYQTAGNGSKDAYQAVLEKEAGREMGTRIIFEGAVNHDQIDGHYRSAAILVNPSLSESFGISLVEAMMRRIPVVATRIGGMTYTVDHGVTGLLVEPANPTALADAICGILDDPDRGRRMGEAGRKKAVEKFSWESTAGVLIKHLQEHGSRNSCLSTSTRG